MTKSKKPKENNIVTQSNFLVEAKQETPLTLQEQRIVLTAISMIEPNDIDFKIQRISVMDFSKLLDMTEIKYDRMEKICTNLMKKPLIIKKVGSQGFIVTNWFQSAEYIEGQGIMEFMFADKLKPYLLQLKKEFTTFGLLKALSFDSTYAIGVYQLAKKWEGIKKFTYELDELREMLGAKKKSYDSFGNFKQIVLNTAKKEINEKSDLEIDFKVIKTGRKVTALEFHVKLKEENSGIKGAKKDETK